VMSTRAFLSELPRIADIKDKLGGEETDYLLRNPTNAKRLLSAVAQLSDGNGV